MKHKIRKRDSAVVKLIKEIENLEPLFFQGEITRLMKLSRIIKESLYLEKKQMQKAYNDGYTTLTSPNFKKYFDNNYNHPLKDNYEDTF